MNETIRLIIVDDHKIVRDGLKAFISPIPGIEIVGEAVNGVEAAQVAAQLKPDVILLDLVMPGMDGIQATHEIKKNDPAVKIIVITSFAEESQVINAIKEGASGYLLKDALPEEIETAIRTVYRGETAFPSRITSILMRELNRLEKPAEKNNPFT